MRVWDFIMRGLRSPQPLHINNERIKAQAGTLQALSLAVFGLAVLGPSFNPTVKVFPGGLVLGGFVGALLFFAAQWRLGYIQEAKAKEATDER